jgi:hypothetical protein
MALMTTLHGAPAFCRASLNYAGAGPTEVVIRDGRRAEPGELPGWEECGFELVHHEPGVTDWADEAQLLAHHEEMAALAKAMTGADEAVVSGHIKRGPEQAAQHKDLGPISFVHSDFADSYRHNVEEATPRASGAERLVILQFWRNLGPAKMDLPLAFCDARTVPRDETQPIPVSNYAGGGGHFEALAVVARPGAVTRHRWYTSPELERDEVVAFRTYDSDRVEDGRPYWTPHSAFRDPDVELGRPSRTSIELRASCLFF